MAVLNKEFTTTIEGIGVFTFRIPRAMRDELAIAAEFSRLTEGVEVPTAWLSAVAEMLSTLKVLTVNAPEDWNVDDMDPLEHETFRKISEVFGALKAAEDRFRGKHRKGSQANGPGDGRHHEPVVSPPVQPAAEPPAVSVADAD